MSHCFWIFLFRMTCAEDFSAQLNNKMPNGPQMKSRSHCVGKPCLNGKWKPHPELRLRAQPQNIVSTSKTDLKDSFMTRNLSIIRIKYKNTIRLKNTDQILSWNVMTHFLFKIIRFFFNVVEQTEVMSKYEKSFLVADMRRCLPSTFKVRTETLVPCLWFLSVDNWWMCN